MTTHVQVLCISFYQYFDHHLYFHFHAFSAVFAQCPHCMMLHCHDINVLHCFTLYYMITSIKLLNSMHKINLACPSPSYKISLKHLIKVHYTVSQKNCANIFFVITLPNFDGL